MSFLLFRVRAKNATLFAVLRPQARAEANRAKPGSWAAGQGGPGGIGARRIKNAGLPFIGAKDLHFLAERNPPEFFATFFTLRK